MWHSLPLGATCVCIITNRGSDCVIVYDKKHFVTRIMGLGHDEVAKNAIKE
jgi:hypothetical protein